MMRFINPVRGTQCAKPGDHKGRPYNRQCRRPLLVCDAPMFSERTAMKSFFIRLLPAAAAALLAASAAQAQAPPGTSAYPTRPVRIIVPFAAGGPSDIFARLIGQKLADQLGKQFYVENLGGAGGNIGMGNAARATPDGYTIAVVSSSFMVNPGLYEKIPYDPEK